jgi:heat shock protein HtpX
MANLAARSAIVLALLFGLLFAIGMGAATYYHLPASYAVIFAVVVVFLQFLLGPAIVSWIYKIDWVSVDEVNPELGKFLREKCESLHLRTPRFGIIHDGNPNAFTYGHFPGNARLVVTSGLLDMLDEPEREAVVGHELGHIVHWDFVVMTIAAIVPLVLYVIYINTRSRGRNNGAYAIAIAVASYIAYIISEYIVLLLSRVREYYADQFSGRLTGNPNALSSGLVKIAYGLATAPIPDEEGKKKSTLIAATGSLGIFDLKAARAMAAASATSGTLSPDTVAGAMQWDLRNPWGAFYEISSTHPLPAKRIRALDQVARTLGQMPIYDFPAGPQESHWGAFLSDAFVVIMPYIGLVIGALAGLAVYSNTQSILAGIGVALLIYSLAYMWKIKRLYPGGSFTESEVKSLVTVIDVSAVRPIPCSLEGTVIGRGMPGIAWSDDLVMQDKNGFIILDYRQPLGFLEFLFGWLKADQFIGQSVKITGWFRRVPQPYIELRDAIMADGQHIKCHFAAYRKFLGIAGIIIGGLMIWMGLYTNMASL